MYVTRSRDGAVLTIGQTVSNAARAHRFFEGRNNRTFEVKIDKPLFESRGTLTQSTEFPSLYTAQQTLPGVPGLLDQQQLRIASLFDQQATGASIVRFIKEDAFTNAATGVEEAGAKPEATLNVSETEAPVRKVAVYVKVTDEMLADQPGMQSYIDGRLMYMVGAREDDLLIDGTGVAPEICGIFNSAGIQTENASTHASVLDAFAHAINKVRSVGFVEPSAIIVNPNDWTDILTTKDANNQYYGGGPFSVQGGQAVAVPTKLWGFPVVVSSFCTEGQALVGAFRIGATIFRRDMSISATNSNSTDFQNNLITIRAEARLALAVFKPLAFCAITNIA